jgi:PAS domain S-box-containing protein
MTSVDHSTTLRGAESELVPAVLEFTHDAIIVWELDGDGVVYWNRAATELYGYSREEARGRVTHDLLKTQLSSGVHELESKLSRHSYWAGELQHTSRDGRTLTVESRISLLSHRNGKWLVLEVNRDITRQRAAEEVLRELGSGLRSAGLPSENGVAIHDERGSAPAAARFARLLDQEAPIVLDLPRELPKVERHFEARCEAFDTYWQGSRNLAKDFERFRTYYNVNYLPRLPGNRDCRVLVTSCGPGYLVNALVKAGYRNVLGIDADTRKIRHGLERGLPCATASAFTYLQEHPGQFDVIIPEQELNHLSIEETIEFLQVCHRALQPGGQVLVYAINGANPLVSPEHISHNIDHFYNVTEYSLAQLLTLGGFTEIQPFACRLYVFWKSPLNYVGLAVTATLELLMRLIYRLYGKKVTILSKRIGSTARKRAVAG